MLIATVAKKAAGSKDISSGPKNIQHSHQPHQINRLWPAGQEDQREEGRKDVEEES
jgi:hypothetical protein